MIGSPSRRVLLVSFLLTAIPAAGAERSPLFNFRWNKGTSECRIELNEGWAKALKVPSASVAIESACRYGKAGWESYRGYRLEKSEAKVRDRQVYGNTDEVMGVLATEPALYWVRWKENGEKRAAFAFCSKDHCNDVHLGPAPAGKVATCVPPGTAMFVPDPVTSCP